MLVSLSFATAASFCFSQEERASLIRRRSLPCLSVSLLLVPAAFPSALLQLPPSPPSHPDPRRPSRRLHGPLLVLAPGTCRFLAFPRPGRKIPKVCRRACSDTPQ